jgi:hypothetical protein
MKAWLIGYYPPDMDRAGGWSKWQQRDCRATQRDWVWFEGEYTEAEARARLAETNR